MNKNVHIVSTIEESNLCKNLNSELEVKDKSLGNRFEVNQFIYIISEEPIKENTNTFNEGLNGDWFYNTIYNFVTNIGDIAPYDFKVVLTNDPRLIADGVQEIQQSFLVSFAENPTDYVEVIDLYGSNLSINMGKSSRYTLAYKSEPKEHQMLTDLKDYFKNTPRAKVLADWEETKKYDNVGITVDDYLQQQHLLQEFEILEGVTPTEFDEKDWARFERFVKSRAEEVKTEERLYTETELFEATLEALDLGMRIRQDQLSGYSDRSGKELHKGWFENYKAK